MISRVPSRITLAAGLTIPRLVCGLWQVADLEKDGTPLDPVATAARSAAYPDAGFCACDMADDHGSADLISRPGREGATAFTKNGDLNVATMKAAVFDDRDLILSLGCESGINIPVVIAGRVLGAQSCPAKVGHYPPSAWTLSRP